MLMDEVGNYHEIFMWHLYQNYYAGANISIIIN